MVKVMMKMMKMMKVRERHFSVLCLMVDKDNDEKKMKMKKSKKAKFSETLKSIIEKNNLEDEGYLRINDIDLNPEKTSKTIEEDMKDFKVNMFINTIKYVIKR